MTTAELEALRGMPTAAIRAAQQLVRAQLVIASRDGNTHALAKLHEWEDDYTDEMLRRLERDLP